MKLTEKEVLNIIIEYKLKYNLSNEINSFDFNQN